MGSKIRIRAETHHFKAIIPGHYSTRRLLGTEGLIESGSLEVESDVPFNHFINDPYDALEVVASTENSIHKLRASFKYSFFKMPVEESGVRSKNSMTYISLSTDNDWTTIANSMKNRFDEILKSPVPASLNSLVLLTSKLSTDEAKINYVVAYLTNALTYLGDWRTLESGFKPRALDEILTTKYGDCKDFASLLTVILRKLKIDSHVALVYRSSFNDTYTRDPELPTIGAFNHAIVRVNIKGKNYWIDPTNKRSFGLYPHSDIAEKSALTLDGRSQLEKIPQMIATDSGTKVVKIVNFTSDDQAIVSGKMIIKGNMVEDFYDDPSTNQVLSEMSQGEKAILVETTGLPEPKTTLFAPLNIDIKYTVASNITTHEEGKTWLRIPNINSRITRSRSNVSDWVGDLWIGYFYKTDITVLYKGVYAAEKPYECHIHSPWIDVERAIELVPEGIKVTLLIEGKANFAFNKDFQKKDFRIYQKDLTSCANNAYMVIRRTPAEHFKPAPQVATLFKNLKPNETIDKRLELANHIYYKWEDTAYGYSDIKKLLNLNMRENPRDPRAFKMLSHSLMWKNADIDSFGASGLRKSRLVLEDGFKYSPNDASLKFHLLANDYYQDKKEEHKAILLEYLKTATLTDPWDLMSLSHLYKTMGMTTEALKALDDGILTAKEPFFKEVAIFQKGAIFSRSKDYEKCSAAYKEVLKIKPTDYWAYFNLNYCQTVLGKFDEALETAKAHKKMAGWKWSEMVRNTLLARAKSHMSQNRLELAEKDFIESSTENPTQEVFLGLSEIYIKRKNFDRAVAVIDEGASYVTNKHTYYYNAATSLNKSINHYVKVMEKSMENTNDPTEKLMVHHCIILAYHHLKMKTEATKYGVKAGEYGESMYPFKNKDAKFLTSLGAIHILTHAYTLNEPSLFRAQKVLLEAKAIDPLHILAQEYLGEAEMGLAYIKNKKAKTKK